MPEQAEPKAYRVTLEYPWEHAEYIVIATGFSEAAEKALKRDLANADDNPSTKVASVAIFGAAECVIT